MSKKIILCGAKGAGKSELLKAYEEINARHGKGGVIDYPYLIPNQLDEGRLGEWALDALADYRTELTLALEREEEEIPLHSISESSLLDSIAYAATRLSYIINDDIGTDDDLARWQIVLHTCGRLLIDSFSFDAIIYVPGNDGETFNEKVEEAIVATIWEFVPESIEKFRLVETEALQRAEEIATILERLDEPGPIDTEPDGEDI